MYKDTENIGYVQHYINKYVFQPPNRSHMVKPEWIRYLRISDNITLTYFSIDPIDPIDKKYILYSHGNGSDLLDYYDQMIKWYLSMDRQVGIIMYDYQGFGWSSGIHTEKNTYNDLTHMVNYCLENLKIIQSNLYLVGQSLGTGILVNFCYTHDWWTTPICLISPYKSISSIIYDHLKYKFIANIIMNFDMYVSQDKIHNIKCKIIIYHGKLDNVILSSHSIELHKKYSDKITLFLLDSASHNNILDLIDTNKMMAILGLVHL